MFYLYLKLLEKMLFAIAPVYLTKSSAPSMRNCLPSSWLGQIIWLPKYYRLLLLLPMVEAKSLLLKPPNIVGIRFTLLLIIFIILLLLLWTWKPQLLSFTPIVVSHGLTQAVAKGSNIQPDLDMMPMNYNKIQPGKIFLKVQ